MTRVPRLTKSRFQAGLQCAKNLWLQCHARELADDISEAQQALFDQGHAVGALAREYFPGGVLVEEDHRHCREALRSTAHLLSEGFTCLYEAAFEHNGVLVRSDVVTMGAEGTFTLVEVKSSTEAKPEHVTDLAVQAHVLRGAGLPVTRCCVLHLNGDYVHPGGAYDLGRLFTLTDVSDQVWQFLPQIPGLLCAMKEMLAGPCPQMRVGRRCESPYPCGFRGHCFSSLPESPVTELPRISEDTLSALFAEGYRSIRDVPPDHPGLTPAQRVVCRVVQSGRPEFDPRLKSELGGLRSPVHFLDFETFRSALPLFAQTRPHQPLPVQWSCHTLDGELRHRDFLHARANDPRADFAASLLSALSGDGPIVVYSSYENTILDSLARDLPDMAEGITGLQERLFDLEKVVRACVQHPGFHGRTSLKFVLPALVDDLSYEGLAVQGGDVATLRYGRAVFGDAADSEREAIFADLRAYCRTDTLALVRLYQTLLQTC